MSWTLPNSMPHLEDGGVQIWRADLTGPHGSELLSHALAALTSEERQRAARMRSGTAPEEFIAGRGFLRRLLGFVMDCDPQGVGIVNGPHRKPELRTIRGIHTPNFNVSHSRGMVLIALSHAGPVGIDIEYMDPAVEAVDVAHTAFHPEDLAQVQRAETQAEKLSAFYRCWTRREAVAKADGRGLTLPAACFSATSDAGEERMVEIHPEDGRPGLVRRFFVRGLDLPDGYQGALALTRAATAPQLFDLTVSFRDFGRGDARSSIHPVYATRREG